MANDQGKSYGVRPLTSPSSPPQILYYRVETSATLQYFRGQFVVVNSNGRVQPVTAVASGGQLISGVTWDFLDDNLSGPPSAMLSLTQGGFLPANTPGFAGVIYNPDQLYVMEEKSGGSAISVNSIGTGASFTYIATTGNTTTGWANVVVNNSGVGATTQNLLQLMGVYNIINNDGTINEPGAYCKWVVRIMRHTFTNSAIPVPQELTTA